MQNSPTKMAAIVLEQQLETLPGSDEAEKKLMKIVLISNTSAKIHIGNCQQRLYHFDKVLLFRENEEASCTLYNVGDRSKCSKAFV